MMRKIQKNKRDVLKRSRQDRAEGWESDAVASDYIVYLFAGIIIRRRWVLPWLCLYYLILK